MSRAALAALLVLGGRAAAAGAAKADKTSAELAEYFLKVPLADADPKFVEPFLAVDPGSLPKKLRGPAAAKQFEIRTLVRLHDTKKAGGIVTPDAGCTERNFTYPPEKLAQFRGFQLPLVEITEDEERIVLERTQCREVDLGCRFSLMVFVDEKVPPKKRKPRRLTLFEGDPMLAVILQARSKAGSGTNFFGAGASPVSCGR